MPTPKGAGFRFGHRSTVWMMRSSAAKIAAAGHNRKARVIEVRLSAEMSHRICQNKRIAIETHGEMWVDTGADTTCAGAGFTVLAYSDQYVTLRGYSDSSDEEERVPVVTAATAIDLEDGTTIILIMNEVLWLGNSQYTSLLNLNQVRYAGHQADDIPLFLS